MKAGVIGAAMAVLVAALPSASRADDPVLLALAPSHVPGADVSELLLASLPGAAALGENVHAIAAAALPPPPTTVVRETRTYGTVTIDHVAHLARRVSCRSCHGPGRVQKIVYTPREAHDACRGCHVRIAKGPTECRGCHVIAPKVEPAILTAEAGADASGKVVAAAGTQTVASHGAAEGLAFSGPLPPPQQHLGRTVEAGITAMVGERQEIVFGPSVQLVARSGSNVMSYTLAVSGATGDGRTQFLIGGGREFELSPRVRATAVVLGGLDAAHSPVTAMPALGARAGIELMSRTRWSVGFSVTALTDLVQSGTMGDRTGGTTVGFTMSVCRPLARR